MNNTHNAVIWYLAIRPCVRESLELLYRNFNNKYHYPVIVFTQGQQYSDEFKQSIHKDVDDSIQFIELPIPKVPAHIPESELFYNRTEIAYVRQFFSSPARIGYLHALHWSSGEFASHPLLRDYDWSLRLDDDTFIDKPLTQNLFDIMQAKQARLADMKVQAQNYERVLDCQTGLRELAIEFQQKHNIIREPWNSICGFGAFTAYDMSIFKEPLWKEWWQTVYDNGGIYKYRWGDVEIHSLYLHMRHSHSVIYNFDYEKQGLTRHGGNGVGFVDKQGRYKSHPPLVDYAKAVIGTVRNQFKR